MLDKKNISLTIGIIIGVIIFVIIILYFKSLNCANPQEELVKCISNNSVLYVQAGCSHCLKQENMFGKCSEMLNIIDCTKTPEKCIETGIRAIPTWEINGTLIEGIYEIEELKNMTGC